MFCLIFTKNAKKKKKVVTIETSDGENVLNVINFKP